MIDNEDLLKDTPETGYEDYTENQEKEGCGCGRGCCQSREKETILIRKESIR